MYENNLPDRGKIIRYGVIIVLIFFIIIAAWYALTHGGIQITTTNKTAEISIVSKDDQNTVLTNSTGTSLFSFQKNGHYIVTIKDGQKQTRTAVDVKPFHIAKVTLTLPDIQVSEAVTNIATSAFAISSSKLALIDSKRGEIVSIDDNNTYTRSHQALSYESALWQNATKGYAVARDKNTGARTLVTIENGAPKAMATPEPITTDTYLAFNYATDGSFYILQDGTFSKADGNGGYQTITTADKRALILSINDRYATFLYQDQDDECSVQFLNLATKKVTKRLIQCFQSPSYNYSAEWSPNGKKLALTTGGSLQILNQDLEVESTIPGREATNPVWVNDTLVYTIGNNVWSYDTAKNITSVIATTPQYVDVHALRKSDDSNTLYFSGSADGELTLYRIVSKADSFSDIQKLSESNMQTLSPFCEIRYINFAKQPQIILSTATSTRAECEQDVKNYTSSINVSLNAYQYDIREELGYSDNIDGIN